MIFHGQILNFGSLKLKDRIGKKKGERRKKTHFDIKNLKLATLIFLVLVQLDIILTSKKKIMEEEKEPLRESLFVFM